MEIRSLKGGLNLSKLASFVFVQACNLLHYRDLK